ncbi:MAG: magnesium transporter [Devosiaceae bacterium]|nr:magnesium transporter [Devosiaceae bacterium]
MNEALENSKNPISRPRKSSPRKSPWRTDQDRLNDEWIKNVCELIEANNSDELRKMFAGVPEADFGDILEAISADQRLALIQLLGEDFDYSSLTEVDEAVRLELIEQLPNTEIARGVTEIDSDDAVFILEDMDEIDRDAILALVPEFERLSLRRSLDFPEETAGRRMQTEFVAIPPHWNVGQTIDYMRFSDDLPDEFHQLYVVNEQQVLLGTVPLDRILRAQRGHKISQIMVDEVIEVSASEDQEDAARVFERFDLVEVAVVDEENRMVGILTVDDMLDVIHLEAEEDILHLAGVGSEEISDNVFEAVKSRITWLLINLVTAVLASFVIGMFDASLQQMVALAVLMPIVASMGGNAGIQTMTVTVRAISTRELDQFNIRRLIVRETFVGLANGVIFALITGLVTAIWFANIALGLVIGIAMIVNMLAAGVSGILIPLGLNKFGADPAVASSAFVTTVTDVVGFFVFLSLAAMWFGLV